MDQKKLNEFIKFCNDGYKNHSEDRKNRANTDTEKLLACLGLAEEAGEIVGLYKKFIAYGDSKPVIREDLISELGDLFHYFCRISHLNDIQLNEIIDFNIQKISKRRGNR